MQHEVRMVVLLSLKSGLQYLQQQLFRFNLWTGWHGSIREALRDSGVLDLFELSHKTVMEVGRKCCQVSTFSSRWHYLLTLFTANHEQDWSHFKMEKKSALGLSLFMLTIYTHRCGLNGPISKTDLFGLKTALKQEWKLSITFTKYRFILPL